MMKRTWKMGRKAGGIFKEPRFLFMVVACWTEKVERWTRQQFSIMVDIKMGSILITILTSCTCFSVHCRFG